MRAVVVLALIALVGGCGGHSPQNRADGGTPRDGPPPPADAAVPDGAPRDGGGDSAALAGHRGSAVMSGAVQAASPRYRVIMSTGQSPGGNDTAASPATKLRGGLVGATQGK